MDAKTKRAIAGQMQQLTGLIEHYYPDFESVYVQVNLPEGRRLEAEQKRGWSEPVIAERFE